MVYVLITWLLCGNKEVFWLMIPGILLLPIYTLIPNLGGAAVPLSEPTEEAKSAGRGALYLVSMFGAMMLAGLATWAQYAHFFLWFLLVEAAVIAAVYFPMRASLAMATWSPYDD